jgi:hypothetical protein
MYNPKRADAVCPLRAADLPETFMHYSLYITHYTLFWISCNYPCLFHYVNAHNMLV